MNYSSNETELGLIEAIKKGDAGVFSYLFRKYYKNLVLYAGTYIPEKEICEDIVQGIFCNIWRDRDKIVIKTSFKSYLLVSVRNRCLDDLRHRKIKNEYLAFELKYRNRNEAFDYIFYSDLISQLDIAMNKLSPEERKIFELSRVSNLKYDEIAEQLNMPVKTVEKRISSVLKQLKVYLKDFLPILFILLTHSLAGLSFITRL